MVRVAGSPDLVLLEEGDLLIVTRGAAHRLFCEPANEHHTLPLDRVIAISGFTGLGALVYGDGNDDAPPS